MDFFLLNACLPEEPWLARKGLPLVLVISRILTKGLSVMHGILVALLLPLAGTVFGSAFVFFMKKEMSKPLEKALLGFASGVMVAASIWSLLMPCMDFAAGDDPENVLRNIPAAVGFLIGILFLLVVDMVVPHLHVGEEKAEGPRSGLSRLAKLTLAVTIHNLPEGMAVGAVLAGVMNSGAEVSLAPAFALALGYYVPIFI